MKILRKSSIVILMSLLVLYFLFPGCKKDDDDDDIVDEFLYGLGWYGSENSSQIEDDIYFIGETIKDNSIIIRSKDKIILKDDLNELKRIWKNKLIF